MTEIHEAQPRPGVPQPIGYALWHLHESRDLTLAYLEGLDEQALDPIPAGHEHSVATLLYHIAVFEVEWVYTDMLGNDYDMERRIPGCPPHVAQLLPYPMLADDRAYTPVHGESLDTHLSRLALIREDLVTVLSGMSVDEFRRPRPSDDTMATPEWILMHLARHESEHRGQIWDTRVAVESELDLG